MNVFGDEYQSVLSAPLRPQITEFFRHSLGGGSELEDIEYQGASGTFAFSPVLVDGQQFATLYVSNLHTFSLKIAPIIDNQRNLSTIFIIAVSSLATVIVFIIFSSNKKLKRLVEERTDDLQRSNESLVESNKKLEDANSQLAVHDKLQQEFAKIAAHELRTPVQPIL